jgi:hypothetical protein
MADNLFRRQDQNGDGLLNYDEMPQSLRAERDKWDANRDGFVDIGEYKSYFEGRSQQFLSDRGASMQPGSGGGWSGPGGMGGSPGGWGGAIWTPAPPVQEQRQRPVVYRSGNLPQNLPAWFTQLDSDEDAQVGLYEWRAGGQSLDEYQRLDRNADGFLTVDEVLRSVAQANGPGSTGPNGRPSFDGGRGSFFSGLGSGPGRDWGDRSRGGFGPGGGMDGRDRSPWSRGGFGSGGFGPGPGGDRGGWGRSGYGPGPGGDSRRDFGDRSRGGR